VSDETIPADWFSHYVCEQIGWYVYALRDPRNGKVFYIGKGQGNRVFAHANDAIASDPDAELSEKLALIKEIQNSGSKVEALIIRHNIAGEKAAYEIEASIIDTLALLDPDMDNDLFGLTNKQGGHHSSTRGLASVSVVQSLYDAPRAPDITVPSLLIRIPGLWTPTMTAAELYDATRQWWKLGERRGGAQYAFAVNHGVIREVYRIDEDSWEHAAWVNNDWVVRSRGKTRRWRFSGAVDDELGSTFRNKSVAHLFKRGAQAPVRYVNC
jgi:hypothetical protein